MLIDLKYWLINFMLLAAALALLRPWHGPLQPVRPAHVLCGIVLGLVPVVLVGALNIALTGSFSVLHFLALPAVGAAQFFLFQLLVAAAEELFFRGCLQGAIRRRWQSPALAVAGSALIFALAHLTGGRAGIAQFLIPLCAGLLFGAAYEKWHGCTMLSLILAHLLYDLAAVNVWL